MKDLYSKSMTTLDLGIFVEKVMTVNLLDGKQINVKRPTKEIVLIIQELYTTEDDREAKVKALVNKAFSNNQEGIEVDCSEWPEGMITGAFTGYINFLNTLTKNPNS